MCWYTDRGGIPETEFWNTTGGGDIWKLGDGNTDVRGQIVYIGTYVYSRNQLLGICVIVVK